MKKNFEALEGGSIMKAARALRILQPAAQATHGRQKICRIVMVTGFKGLF
jgi:hypothetical protein